MGPAALGRWVHSLRGPKEEVDPAHPIGWRWDPERALEGETESVLTVFLAGAECRFSCTFCDLWRNTLDGPTPIGALPRQLDEALSAAGSPESAAAIKLYNASNFFDRRAVPREDYRAIAERLKPFGRVVVESHPKLLGSKALEFAGMLSGRLEVALGLEIADSELLRQLNKDMTLRDFERAVRFLLEAGIAVRAFVLLGPPFVPREKAVKWAVRSAGYARDLGATYISIIPTRTGSGALDALMRDGRFEPPTLDHAEEALEATLQGATVRTDAVVTLDLWDAERLIACHECGPRRIDRLARMNLSGRLEPRWDCSSCGWR
ncbi:MAG: radical SAM protein [Gemmatimonadales bacterium]